MDTITSSPHQGGSAANGVRKRALVLGGGGSAGNAWLIGVIAGLAHQGLDVTHADLTVGTSAGATAAAQLTSSRPSELFDAILASPLPTAPLRNGGGASEHLERFRQIIRASNDASQMRRAIGAMAMAASDEASTQRWRSMVAARIPGASWPAKALLITAVDAHTGAESNFDGRSGVDLIDAVAASTSGGGTAFRIADAWYIDGGYRRSSENADLAAGYQRVLVLSPLGGRSLYPPEWGAQLAVQVEELRAGGSTVETVLPGPAALAAFGDNMMNLAARRPAAQAGFEQGKGVAETLAEFWS